MLHVEGRSSGGLTFAGGERGERGGLHRATFLKRSIDRFISVVSGEHSRKFIHLMLCPTDACECCMLRDAAHHRGRVHADM